MKTEGKLMSTNNRNIENEGDFEKDKNISGRPQGTNTGPVAGVPITHAERTSPAVKETAAALKKAKEALTTMTMRT